MDTNQEHFERVKGLLDAVVAANEAKEAAWGRSYHNWSYAGADPALQQAQTEERQTYKNAEAAYRQAAGAALERIAQVELAAEAARRAVLDRHAGELEQLRATVAAAKTARDTANQDAEAKTKAARQVYDARTQAEADAAMQAARKALVALVVGAAGGPVQIPGEPLKIGARRHFERILDLQRGIYLVYQLGNRDKHDKHDEEPEVSAVVELDVTLPDGLARRQAAITTQYHHGKTFPEAIRAAEDAAVAEGWLAR